MQNGLDMSFALDQCLGCQFFQANAGIRLVKIRYSVAEASELGGLPAMGPSDGSADADSLQEPGKSEEAGEQLPQDLKAIPTGMEFFFSKCQHNARVSDQALSRFSQMSSLKSKLLR